MYCKYRQIFLLSREKSQKNYFMKNVNQEKCYGSKEAFTLLNMFEVSSANFFLLTGDSKLFDQKPNKLDIKDLQSNIIFILNNRLKNQTIKTLTLL